MSRPCHEGETSDSDHCPGANQTRFSRLEHDDFCTAEGLCSSMAMTNSVSQNRTYRFHRGPVASCIANMLQAVNFISDRFLRPAQHASSDVHQMFAASMTSAFAEAESFLVTGAPHASAYYPRDFAWFYPDVLDPDTIIDSEDAVRRVRLLERSVHLMLEAVRCGVVTTTIVPMGRKRYIGIDYFSRLSDTLLGILAGLEQLIG